MLCLFVYIIIIINMCIFIYEHISLSPLIDEGFGSEFRLLEI